jgi:hypothetical protein
LHNDTRDAPKKNENFENNIEKNDKKNENIFDKNLKNEKLDDEILNMDDLSMNDSFNDIEINKSNKLNSFINSNKMRNNDNEKIQNIQISNENTDKTKKTRILEDEIIDTPNVKPEESSNTAYTNFLQKNSKQTQPILELSDTFENLETEHLKNFKTDNVDNEKINIDNLSIDSFDDKSQDISIKNAQNSVVEKNKNKLNAFMNSTSISIPKSDVTPGLYTGNLLSLLIFCCTYAFIVVFMKESL